MIGGGVYWRLGLEHAEGIADFGDEMALFIGIWRMGSIFFLP